MWVISQKRGFGVSPLEFNNIKKGTSYTYQLQRNISLRVIVFDQTFSSVLSYMARPYSEETAMGPEVSYITCDTSYHEQIGDIITFAQFE